MDIDDVKEEQRAALASVAKAMQYGVAGRKRGSPEKLAARPVKRARYDSDGGSSDSESDSDEDDLPGVAGSEESDPETGHSSGTDQEVGVVNAEQAPTPEVPEGQQLNTKAVIVSSPTTSAHVAAPVPETETGISSHGSTSSSPSPATLHSSVDHKSDDGWTRTNAVSRVACMCT